MHTQKLFFIITALIITHASAMEPLPEVNEAPREIPSLRTTIINTIINGHGNTPAQRQKSSAQLLPLWKKAMRTTHSQWTLAQ